MELLCSVVVDSTLKDDEGRVVGVRTRVDEGSEKSRDLRDESRGSPPNLPLPPTLVVSRFRSSVGRASDF